MITHHLGTRCETGPYRTVVNGRVVKYSARTGACHEPDTFKYNWRHLVPGDVDANGDIWNAAGVETFMRGK